MQEEKKKKHAIEIYLKKKGLRKDFFCKKAKIKGPSLSIYLKGSDMLLSTASRIVDAFDGEISFEDLANGIKKTNLN